MDNNLKILNILKVYEGSMAKGKIDNTHKMRHSDAFVYFFRGCVEYVFSDVSFTASAGSVVFLPKSSSYRMRISEPSDYYVVDFEFESSEAVRRGAEFKKLSPGVKADFEKLLYTHHGTEPWSQCDAYSLLYRIYSACVRSERREYSKSGELYSAAMKFILDNYSSHTVSVSDIAEHVEVSEVHLRRIFKSHTATSPMQYVNCLRIEKAKNLLTESNLAISDVARLSGFSDPYYFSREFKKSVGITPTGYKKQKTEKP